MKSNTKIYNEDLLNIEKGNIECLDEEFLIEEEDPDFLPFTEQDIKKYGQKGIISHLENRNNGSLFLLTDGTILDCMLIGSYTHEDCAYSLYVDKYSDKDNTNYIWSDLLEKFQNELGVITLNAGIGSVNEDRCKLVIGKKPTNAQCEVMREWLDKCIIDWDRKLLHMFVGPTAHFVTYNFEEINEQDWAPDYIVDKIQRFFAFGDTNFYESLKNHNKETKMSSNELKDTITRQKCLLQESDFDYGTQSISDEDLKNGNVFDVTTTGISYYDQCLPTSKYHQYMIDRKNVEGKIVKMTPNTYFTFCAQRFGTTFSHLKSMRENDKKTLEELKDILVKKRKKFPIPFISYHTRDGQEGLHRMLVVGDMYGWDKEFPVLITDWADEQRHLDDIQYEHDREIESKLNDVMLNVLGPTYDTWEEFLNELEYDIEEKFGMNSNYHLDIDKDEFSIEVEGVKVTRKLSDIKTNDKEKFNQSREQKKEEPKTIVDDGDKDIDDLLAELGDLDDLDLEEVVKDKNTFIFNNKRCWSGSVSLLDGVIEETHSYKEAANNDFHHMMYFSEEQIEKMDIGENAFFFIEDNGSIHIDPTNRNDAKFDSEDIKKKIKSQIKLISNIKEGIKDESQDYYRLDIIDYDKRRNPSGAQNLGLFGYVNKLIDSFKDESNWQIQDDLDRLNYDVAVLEQNHSIPGKRMNNTQFAFTKKFYEENKWVIEEIAEILKRLGCELKVSKVHIISRTRVKYKDENQVAVKWGNLKESIKAVNPEDDVDDAAVIYSESPYEVKNFLLTQQIPFRISYFDTKKLYILVDAYLGTHLDGDDEAVKFALLDRREDFKLDNQGRYIFLPINEEFSHTSTDYLDYTEQDLIEYTYDTFRIIDINEGYPFNKTSLYKALPIPKEEKTIYLDKNFNNLNESSQETNSEDIRKVDEDTNNTITITRRNVYHYLKKHFYNKTTDELLNICKFKTTNELPKNSPAFILPNGKILDVEDIIKNSDYNGFTIMHLTLVGMMTEMVLKYELEKQHKIVDVDYLSYDNVVEDTLYWLEDHLGWIRTNYGTSNIEDRCYCSLPPKNIKITDNQYPILLEFFDNCLLANKEKVLLFFGNDKDLDEIVYSLKEYIPDEIVKKIKKYYNTGRLEESKQDISIYDIGLSSEEETKKDYNTNWYYIGNCIDTVDELEYWDATEMAQWLDHCKLYRGDKKLIDAPKSCFSRNLVCGVNEETNQGFVYNVDEDIHYFFDIENKGKESVNNVPQYLYHATYKPFLNSIKEKGLGNTTRKMWSDSKGENVVYLATDKDEAYSYAETAEWLDDIEDDEYSKYADNIVVLKIDTSKLDKSKLFKDENVIDGNTTYEYHSIIPFEYVSEILEETLC